MQSICLFHEFDSQHSAEQVLEGGTELPKLCVAQIKPQGNSESLYTDWAWGELCESLVEMFDLVPMMPTNMQQLRVKI